MLVDNKMLQRNVTVTVMLLGVASALYGYHVTHSVSQIRYPMYKTYEHAQSVGYSIIIRRCGVASFPLRPFGEWEDPSCVLLLRTKMHIM